MKIRLAKKIMKYKSIVDEYNNGDGSVCDGMKESYWLKRMFNHINGVYDETFDTPVHVPFKDHRIIKAEKISARYSRKLMNCLTRLAGKTPFEIRDTLSSSNKLKKYDYETRNAEINLQDSNSSRNSDKTESYR